MTCSPTTVVATSYEMGCRRGSESRVSTRFTIVLITLICNRCILLITLRLPVGTTILVLQWVDAKRLENREGLCVQSPKLIHLLCKYIS